jgi:TPP-dependent 2-oxoacid decarboxylase
MNIPIAADLLSKSAIPENHWLYLGVYGGAMSSGEHMRKYVESADLVLMLGTFITDMSMGFYTAKLDRKQTVLATTERVTVHIIVMSRSSFAICSSHSRRRKFVRNNSNIQIPTTFPNR